MKWLVIHILDTDIEAYLVYNPSTELAEQLEIANGAVVNAEVSTQMQLDAYELIFGEASNFRKVQEVYESSDDEVRDFHPDKVIILRFLE
jgi:catalase (peroxidase I)